MQHVSQTDVSAALFFLVFSSLTNSRVSRGEEGGVAKKNCKARSRMEKKKEK